MRQLWHEYGLIALLIVGSMGTYWYYSQHEETLLTASLDVLGTRLAEMVDGDRGAVAGLFERFKQNVAEREVSPDQIASLTANVLNLQNSGARLTPEDVEMILTPLPEVALLPAPAAPEALAEAGEDLEAMLTFEATLRDALSPDMQRIVRRNIQFHAGDGLQVIVDGGLREALPAEVWGRLYPALKRLEQENRVRWDRHLADTRERRRARSVAERRAMAAFRKQWEADGNTPEAPQRALVENLAALEALKHLEAMGYVPAPDSIDTVRALKRVLARAYSTDASHPLTDAMEKYGDQIEAYLEAYRVHVEAYYRALEAGEAAPEDAGLSYNAPPQGAQEPAETPWIYRRPALT